jgi:hypothetical protein
MSRARARSIRIPSALKPSIKLNSVKGLSSSLAAMMNHARSAGHCADLKQKRALAHMDGITTLLAIRRKPVARGLARSSLNRAHD